MILIKNRYILFTILILFAAICISLLIIRHNWYYTSVFLANLLFFVFYKKGAIQTRLFITSIILIISFLVIFTMDNFIFYFFNENSDFKFASFLFGLISSVSLLIVPFGYFFNDFEQKVIDQGLKNRIARKHPNLICTKHLTRTSLHSHFIYNAAICRNNNNCSNEDIIFAKQLTGLIGKKRPEKQVNGDFYVELLGDDKQVVKNGDYDIIEIHKNNEIEDYDAIISKVTSFFYNELNRHKPINKILVKIFGSIPISESTKRLLERNYFTVEYLKEQRT